MNVCENEIRDAIEAELVAANEKHPPFASLHEAYAVILEEYEEADDELMACNEFMQDVWRYTKEDNTKDALEAFEYLEHRAEYLAQEACQVAAMANKAKQSFADKMRLEEIKNEARKNR